MPSAIVFNLIDYICTAIDEWVEKTYKKYGVNLNNFAQEWVIRFWDNQKLWPVGHKMKSESLISLLIFSPRFP